MARNMLSSQPLRDQHTTYPKNDLYLQLYYYERVSHSELILSAMLRSRVSCTTPCCWCFSTAA